MGSRLCTVKTGLPDTLYVLISQLTTINNATTQQRNKNADICDSFAVTCDYVGLNLMLDAEFRMLTIVSIEIILLDFWIFFLEDFGPRHDKIIFITRLEYTMNKQLKCRILQFFCLGNRSGEKKSHFKWPERSVLL